MMQICRGCFTHLAEGIDKCPRCGWTENDHYVPGFRWEMGEVCENRYLMGGVYFVSGPNGICVFRAFDNAMKRQVFIMICRSKDPLTYKRYAQAMMNSLWADRGDLVVLCLKDIKGEPAIVFSLSDIYADRDVFELQLYTETIVPDEIPEPEEENVEREQTLANGTILDKRFRILSCIGIGGFGITYLCEDLKLERRVAVKEYFPSEWSKRDESFVTVKNAKILKAYRFGLSAFYKEIERSAEFIHTPHLITVLDTFTQNDTAYLVMEYIDGISMGRWLRMRDYKPFTPKELIPVISTVLDVLACMHEKKIIHSDISPGNILFTQNKEVYVIDLGAAKYLNRSNDTLHTVFLKPEYAAPEQYLTARDKRPLGEGPWTDLYGLGATAYYLLTGEKPVDVVTRLEKKGEAEADFDWGALSPGWASFLEKALEMDYTMRYSNAAIMRSALEERILNEE